jgi:hypothetical protein
LGFAPIYQFSLWRARCSPYANGAARRSRNRSTGKDPFNGILVKMIPQGKRNIETTSNTTNMRR